MIELFPQPRESKMDFLSLVQTGKHALSSLLHLMTSFVIPYGHANIKPVSMSVVSSKSHIFKTECERR